MPKRKKARKYPRGLKCKNGRLKNPVKTPKGGTRYCKKR